MSRKVWFWHRIISPHMAGLAKALADEADEVVYVAEKRMSAARAAAGWGPAELGNVRLHIAPDVFAAKRLAFSAPEASIHICQGLRRNGVIGPASKVLARKSLRCWVAMETVDDKGLRGLIRRIEYSRLIRTKRRRLEGILATGNTTPDWLIDRGMPRARVFPFAYFLPIPPKSEARLNFSQPFQIIFVGVLAPRKGVDLLIDAIANLKPFYTAELTIVGSGPLEDDLRQRGQNAGLNVRWLGTVPITEVTRFMAQADCLVLPSRHDGWGAVASEAMLVGTPVICSDACGASVVVQASGQGSIFPSGNAIALQAALASFIERGHQDNLRRLQLAKWAHCLGAEAGAKYLLEILRFVEAGGCRPVPPWEITGDRRERGG